MKKNSIILIKIIDILIFLITNIAVIYISKFNNSDEYSFMFVLPLIFEISYFFSLRRCIIKFKEFGIVFFLIAFARYVILPVLIIFNGGYNGRGYTPTLNSFKMALGLMAYELAFSSIIIHYLTKKMKPNTNNNKEIVGPSSLFIYFAFMGFILILVGLNPSVIKAISFVLPNKKALNYDDFKLTEQIAIMSLMIIKQLIFVIGVYKCKKQYDKTNKKIFIIISALLLIMNSVLYFGSNRSDFLLLVVASIIYWIIIFKKFNKVILGATIVFGVIIFLAITDVRQYAAVSKNKIVEYTDMIQIYTGGPYNVAVAIETSSKFSENGNLGTLIFDFVRPTLGINLIAKQINLKYSNIYFNYTLFGTDNKISQIMPMIGEGYYCLGFVFSPLVEMVFIYIAFKLKMIVNNKKQIELIYFFTITMLRLGFIMGQNATIQMNDLSFNLFVPIILLWFNNKILLRGKSDE